MIPLVLVLVLLAESKEVSFWVNLDASTIDGNLVVVQQHAHIIDSVQMYCAFGVDEHGDLVHNLPDEGDYALCGEVIGALLGLGVDPYIIISATDINGVRKLFGNPSALTHQLVQLSADLNVTGWILAFEPEGSNASDAAAYVTFLKHLRDAFNATGTKLKVMADSSSGFFSDFKALAPVVDKLINMDVYTALDLPTWQTDFAAVVREVPSDVLVVALGCVKQWEESTVNARLKAITTANVTEISIFVLDVATNNPLPFWWPHLEAWKA